MDDNAKSNVKIFTTLNKSAAYSFRFLLDPKNTPTFVEGIVVEETNESPTRLGTVYRNQGHDGSWAEFDITAYEQDVMFQMTKRDDNHHVRYTFKILDDTSCELEYCIWVAEGEISKNVRFSEENLNKIVAGIKEVIDASQISGS